MRTSGFTLVELMIAVAILAIIAAVALPIYTQYSERTFRSEAQADLLLCAQGLERFAAQNFSYAGASLADVCDPESVARERYNFGLENLGDNTFRIVATPINRMAGDGVMTYDQTGERGWARNGSNNIADVEPGWEE